MQSIGEGELIANVAGLENEIKKSGGTKKNGSGVEKAAKKLLK
jgi:hypothetical protein